MSESSRSSVLSPTILLTSVIVILLLIPLGMDWMDFHRDKVQLVGRVCGGLAAALAIYGVFTKLLKVIAFLAGVAITLAILVSEGVIKLPNF